MPGEPATVIIAIGDEVVVVWPRLCRRHALESTQRVDDGPWQRIVAAAVHDDVATVEVVGLGYREPERFVADRRAGIGAVGQVRSDRRASEPGRDGCRADSGGTTE